MSEIELLFRVFDLDEKGLILFIVEILNKRLQVDLYLPLRLSVFYGPSNLPMQTNFLIQCGLLSLNKAYILADSDTRSEEKVSFSSKEVKILLYRLLLKALGVNRTSQDMI